MTYAPTFTERCRLAGVRNRWYDNTQHHRVRSNIIQGYRAEKLVAACTPSRGMCHYRRVLTACLVMLPTKRPPAKKTKRETSLVRRAPHMVDATQGKITHENASKPLNHLFLSLIYDRCFHFYPCVTPFFDPPTCQLYRNPQTPPLVFLWENVSIQMMASRER